MTTDTTNGPEAIEYVVNHSKSQFIVAEDKKQLDKILEVHEKFEHLKAIIIYNDEVPQVDCNVPIMGWAEFMRHGAGKHTPNTPQSHLQCTQCKTEASQASSRHYHALCKHTRTHVQTHTHTHAHTRARARTGPWCCRCARV